MKLVSLEVPSHKLVGEEASLECRCRVTLDIGLNIVTFYPGLTWRETPCTVSSGIAMSKSSTDMSPMTG